MSQGGFDFTGLSPLMCRDVQYGPVKGEDGRALLGISYLDRDGVKVRIYIEPNPNGASRLLRVDYGGKGVDPLPVDNLLILDVEAALRAIEGNVADLGGYKFCSLFSYESSWEFRVEGRTKRTMNMSNRRYLFGRLWYHDDELGDTLVYWTRHFAEGKAKFTYDPSEGKLIAWAAMERGQVVEVQERHQEAVRELFRRIVENDTKALVHTKD